MTQFTESTVEDAALAWLEAIGWRIAHGADIAPDAPRAERAEYSEVILAQRSSGRNVERYLLLTLRTPSQVPPEHAAPGGRPSLHLAAMWF